MNRIMWIAATLAVAGCKEEQAAAPPAGKTPAATETTVARPQEIPVTSTSADARLAFQRGRELLEDARDGEAEVQFQRAVEMDPKFALGHAYLGISAPDPEGTRHMRQALALSAGLPELEHLLIEQMAAGKSGDEAK